MRKPEQIERLYLDFDGFFASVAQTGDPSLRDRPVGVVPFDGAGDSGILIACSREAKEQGVKNVMRVAQAREICPDLVLVTQNPDHYRRAHNALLAEIGLVIPVDAVKSIDEITCRRRCCRKRTCAMHGWMKSSVTFAARCGIAGAKCALR